MEDISGLLGPQGWVVLREPPAPAPAPAEERQYLRPILYPKRCHGPTVTLVRMEGAQRLGTAVLQLYCGHSSSHNLQGGVVCRNLEESVPQIDKPACTGKGAIQQPRESLLINSSVLSLRKGSIRGIHDLPTPILCKICNL